MNRANPYRFDDQAPTVTYVARWLFNEVVRRGGFLSEPVAALEIVRHFDGPFVRMRPSGSYAVGPGVLRELRRIAGDRLVWDTRARGWHLT